MIEAKNASRENKYIRSAYLNGRKVNGFRIPLQEIMKGGRLVLNMCNSY